jgi:ubiquinone/menaquinone biosynthesis C-methylase UbiE
MLYYGLLIAVIIFQGGVVVWLLLGRNTKAIVEPVKGGVSPERVGEYYNQTTDKFLAVYGEIIQAFRTNNVEDYLDYTIESMQLKQGMTAIDAGCGVCGPAVYFAQKLKQVDIHAVTMSEVQVEKSKQKIIDKQAAKSVNVRKGDYHLLDELYPKESADRVYFLESFGHSNNKQKAIQSSWQVLKPGGKLYIKDLFLRESNNEWEQEKINKIATQINEAYAYQIADFHQVIAALRKRGFLIEFVRPPQVDRDKFEHLTISNDFQNLFDIGKIDSWDDYVFPIDFYEILAEKPTFHLHEQLHLYFMNR